MNLLRRDGMGWDWTSLFGDWKLLVWWEMFGPFWVGLRGEEGWVVKYMGDFRCEIHGRVGLEG